MSVALDRKLAALADPSRRKAVDMLGAAPRRSGELAAALGLTAPAMSRHLRALRQAGLVEESHPEFDARVRIYRLKAGGMDELKAWLEHTEQGWAEQLAAFRTHLEKDA